MVNNVLQIRDIIGKITEFVPYNRLFETSTFYMNEGYYLKKLKLSRKYSLLFYKNNEMKEEILTKIYNSNKQLELELSYQCITYTNQLKNLYTLDLSFTNIEDVRLLGNIHYVYLRGCQNITDISPLKKVFKLDLSDCKNIINVDPLENVHYLDLSNTNIIDINKLVNVHTLKINNCKNIKNINNYFNSNILEINTCTDLNNTKYFKNVHNLSLINCINIVDIMPLENVTAGTLLNDTIL
jgi:hypothetical protein